MKNRQTDRQTDRHTERARERDRERERERERERDVNDDDTSYGQPYGRHKSNKLGYASLHSCCDILARHSTGLNSQGSHFHSFIH